MKPIVFKGSIAATQSSLKFGGKIGRVTFEVPESEISNAVALIALQETPLKITVEVDTDALTRIDDNGKNDGEQTQRRAARNPLEVAGG